MIASGFEKFQVLNTTNTSPINPHKPGKPKPAKKMPTASPLYKRHQTGIRPPN